MSDNRDDLTIAYMAGYHDAKSKYADEIERLREALRPFAEKSTDCDSGYEWLVVKRDDCDKARAALGEGKE